MDFLFSLRTFPHFQALLLGAQEFKESPVGLLNAFHLTDRLVCSDPVTPGMILLTFPFCTVFHFFLFNPPVSLGNTRSLTWLHVRNRRLGSLRGGVMHPDFFHEWTYSRQLTFFIDRPLDFFLASCWIERVSFGPKISSIWNL